MNAFSLEEIKKIYTDFGEKIFPLPFFNLKNVFSPKYIASGLEGILNQYFGNDTLQECKTPILVSAYDVNEYKTFFYNSRFVNPTSKDSMGSTQIKLVDVCRSTSAAPTYFSSHYFSLFNEKIQSSSKHNLIDGGVFVNNPTLAALSEVLENSTDPLYKQVLKRQIELQDIYILSLGTGITAKSITEKQGANWGQYKWAKHLFVIMMQGSSQSVHSQMSVLFPKDHYLRLNIMIPKDASEMDDASKKTSQTLINQVNRDIINNQVALSNLSNFVTLAGL